MPPILQQELERLASDMAKARVEEKALKEAGKQQILVFLLKGPEEVRVHALRAIVAARAFEGKLEGAGSLKEVSEEGEEGGEEGGEGGGGVGGGEGGGGAEAGGGEDDTIVLRDVRRDLLELAVSYMYTGSFEVEEGNVHEMLELGRRMCLPGVINICSSFLSERMSIASVCRSLISADKSGAGDLKDLCLGFIDSNARDVLGHASFVDLPKNVLQELLARDSLGIEEEDVFLAVMRWGKKQAEIVEKEAREKKEAAPLSEQGEGQGEAQEEVGGGGGGAAAAAREKLDDRPWLEIALSGVVDRVRFPLISPAALQDVVQPALTVEHEGERRCIAEKFVLEGYQHHALAKIGQPSN
eukprot:750099-Hanusia_phi.AAC.1